MLNLRLNVKATTARRLKKVLEYSRDEEAFAQNVIAHQMAELRRAIVNLKFDMQVFEAKYQLSSHNFYEQFSLGETSDDEDFVTWAGLVEMLNENEKRLRELEE
jgi:polysaccharide pyruvyl transferase WcaK-like protein